jgi:hypothetical protein
MAENFNMSNYINIKYEFVNRKSLQKQKVDE